MCANAFSPEFALAHARVCEPEASWFFFERNLMLFSLNFGRVAFNGAPYLGEGHEDDCQRYQRIPLYRSQELMDALRRHLHWRLHYKCDEGQMAPLDRVIDIVRGWYRKTRDE